MTLKEKVPESAKRANHTPGPWKFERNADYVESFKLLGKPLPAHEGYSRENDGTWAIADSTGLRVASASFKGSAKRGQGWQAPDPEGQANARLIAAAPELLEALEAVTAFLGFTHDYKTGYTGAVSIVRKADAAIRKAKGGQL